MNYTTGIPTTNEITETKLGCVPDPNRIRTAPPPLPQQLEYLAEKVGWLADRVNRLSSFLTDTTIDPDRIEDKCVSASIAYCVRMLDAMSNKLDYINEFCR